MKMNKGIFFASIGSFLIVSITLTIMALGTNPYLSSTPIIKLICGICFWLFLVLGIVLQIVLSNRIRKWKSKFYRIRRSMRMNPKPGIISFFKNIPGMISDILFIVSILTLVISYFLSNGTSIVCYISLSLAFCSFCTHCIFNGKNFYYMINQRQIEEMYKKSMEESR